MQKGKFKLALSKQNLSNQKGNGIYYKSRFKR